METTNTFAILVAHVVSKSVGLYDLVTNGDLIDMIWTWNRRLFDPACAAASFFGRAIGRLAGTFHDSPAAADGSRSA